MSMSIDISKGTYYSVADAAEFIGVTPGRIRQMVRDGVIESIKVDDRCYIISEKNLRKHLKPQEKGRPRINSIASD